jgi:hypothetical protein
MQVVNSSQLKMTTSEADIATTAMPAGAKITQPNYGSQMFRTFATPSNLASTRLYGPLTLTAPVAGVTYAASRDFVDPANGNASISRTCGPVAPAAPTQASAPTSNMVTVAVSAVAGATSYTCGAFVGSATESSRASGSNCTIYGLSASTTYTIKVRASDSEGTGEWSSGLSQTTASNSSGGGGGSSNYVWMTFGSLPTGITKASYSTGTLNTSNSSGSNSAFVDWGNGAFIGSYDYLMGQTISYSHITPSGRDADFGDAGEFTVTDASQMTWYGPANGRMLTFNGQTGPTTWTYAVSDPNADTAPTVSDAVTTNIENACDAESAGSVPKSVRFLSASTAKPLVEIACGASVGITNASNRYFAFIDPTDDSVEIVGSVFSGYDNTFYSTGYVGLSTNPEATGSELAVIAVYSSGEASSTPSASMVYDVVGMRADGTMVAPTALVRPSSVGFSLWPRFSGSSARAYSIAPSVNPTATPSFRFFTFAPGSSAVSEATGTLDSVSAFQNSIDDDVNPSTPNVSVDMSMLRTLGNGSGSSVYFSRIMLPMSPSGAASNAVVKVTISGSSATMVTSPILTTPTASFYFSPTQVSLLNADDTNVYGYGATSASAVDVVTFAKSAISGAVVTPPAPTKANPTMPRVGTAVKVKKTFTIALKSTGGTTAAGHNANGLITTVVSKTAANCSVTAVKHKTTKKVTGYTVLGKKKGTCKVEVKVTGNNSFNAKTQQYTIKVS